MARVPARDPFKQEKDIQRAFVNPSTGDVSIVGGGGGDMTREQQRRQAELISGGYSRITDPEQIRQIQKQVGGAQKFTDKSQFQNLFSQLGLSATGPTEEEMGVARRQLEELKRFEERAKPVFPQLGTREPISERPGSDIDSGFRRPLPEGIDDKFARPRPEDIDMGFERPRPEGARPETSRPVPSLDGLQDAKKQDKLNKMKEVFNKAFESQKSQIESQREALTPRFREERGRIGVEDVMARTAAEKMQATQGLSGAGSGTQSAIAQNILTQGALGRSRMTEAEQNRLLDQAILQAAQQRDLGIAQEELGQQRLAEERAFQQQLLSQQQAREDALRREQFAREDALLQQQLGQTQQEQQRQDFLSTIGRFSQDFTAEINRVANDGDPSNDWQIPFLEQARQEKIATQGLDPATGQPLPLAPDEASILDLAQWKVREGIPLSEQEAQLLGVQSGYVAPQAPTTPDRLTMSNIATNARYKISQGIPLSAEEAQIMGVQPGYVAPEEQRKTVVEDRFDDRVFTSAVSNALGNLGEFASPAERVKAAANVLVGAVQRGEITSDEQLTRLMIQYGISEADIDRLLGGGQTSVLEGQEIRGIEDLIGIGID